MNTHHEFDRSPNESITGHEGANINVVRIELGKETLVIVLLLAVVIGACGLIMGLNLAKQAEMDRDFRAMQTAESLKERRLMDMEAYAVLNGWKIPGDDTHGPTGNWQRMIPQEKK